MVGWAVGCGFPEMGVIFIFLDGVCVSVGLTCKLSYVRYVFLLWGNGGRKMGHCNLMRMSGSVFIDGLWRGGYFDISSFATKRLLARWQKDSLLEHFVGLSSSVTTLPCWVDFWGKASCNSEDSPSLGIVTRSGWNVIAGIVRSCLDGKEMRIQLQ